MGATDELRRLLDERGVEYVSIGGITNWGHAEFDELADGSDTRLIVLEATPEQAIAATVGRCDTMGLWPEWEQVLFANVSDEVAQDNLNECVHELLDKAATMCVGTCHSTSNWTNVFKCSVCGFEYDFVTDPYQGPRYCPMCGKKVVSE